MEVRWRRGSGSGRGRLALVRSVGLILDVQNLLENRAFSLWRSWDRGMDVRAQLDLIYYPLTIT